ncbi:MAG: hypothetical protein ACOC56_03360 [Atribacterota bacterium]
MSSIRKQGREIVLYLHVGLHKTGTTFLQRNVLNSFPNVKYLGKLGKPTKINKLYKNILEDRHKKYIFSDEAIIGGLNPRYTIKDGSWLKDQISGIKALGELFPNARIIIGFRRHEKLLSSMYRHYLKYGGKKKIEQYFSFDEKGIIKPEDLIFKIRLDNIEKHFNHLPFVYTLEEIQYNFDNFINRLNRYIGEECLSELEPHRKFNIGVNHYQAKMLLFLNRLFKTSVEPQILRRTILNYFKISNYHLSRYLLFFDKQSFKLPKSLEDKVKMYYKEDWDYIDEYIKRNTDIK